MSTAEQWASLAAAGRYWWYRPSDKTFHATSDHTQLQATDKYLLDASPEWLSQFGGDWQALIDYLSPLMGRLDTLGDE